MQPFNFLPRISMRTQIKTPCQNRQGVKITKHDIVGSELPTWDYIIKIR